MIGCIIFSLTDRCLAWLMHLDSYILCIFGKIKIAIQVDIEMKNRLGKPVKQTNPRLHFSKRSSLIIRSGSALFAYVLI